ncbi:MAG: geranylgeranyl reductase family protein [Euzebyaceae bacterium]|nr:geranylgeranyl reductase family protein [Euzebyaceae bacterium]
MTLAPRAAVGVATADAVVVGAGPAGSAAAWFLAEAGHDVVLCEKETFPRDKVCGDGLTPRAVKALRMLGLEDEAEGSVPGWDRQGGLRMYGGGVVLDLPWPDLDDWPAHSVTATRSLFDHTLARNAQKAGVQLWEDTEVLGPVWLTESERRVAGVRYRRADGAEGVVRAPVVLAADGGSSRFAVQLGLHRDEARPMGVAVRAYYRSPRAAMGMMEGFLELSRDRPGGGSELLPGYGWIFPLDDGLVNVGWGLLNTSEHFRSTNYRRTLDEWVGGFPPEWEITRETMVGRPRSAGLPMGHNRKPPVHRGAILVGDAAGMVNPFNGEGISYAIEAAAFAAEAVDAALRARSDSPLHTYERAVAQAWGGYYTLGRLFVRIIGHPEVMRFCTVHGMPRPALMTFVFRLMAHLTNRDSRDVTDRVVNALSRVVPAA